MLWVKIFDNGIQDVRAVGPSLMRAYLKQHGKFNEDQGLVPSPNTGLSVDKYTENNLLVL